MLYKFIYLFEDNTSKANSTESIIGNTYRNSIDTIVKQIFINVIPVIRIDSSISIL